MRKSHDDNLYHSLKGYRVYGKNKRDIDNAD